MGCSRARVEHVTWNEDIWETIPYISQKFIIAHFATSEWNKLHQILKVVSISAKRFTYAFLSFSLVFSSFFRWF